MRRQLDQCQPIRGLLPVQGVDEVRREPVPVLDRAHLHLLIVLLFGPAAEV